ncbi:MAG TPA: magnesium/cobalt transporter CorA [Actinomycetes bacterium]|nr:magnesium/cobalt transporter CorA [Actinomycetes bacterium]
MIKVRALLDGQQVEDVAMADLPAVRARQGTLVWVEVVSPSPEELATLGEEFGIHEVALEDLQVGERQRPKVEQYQDQILLVAYGALTGAGEKPTRVFEVDLVAGPNYLLTFHGGGPVDHGPIARRVKARPELASEGAGYLLYVALDELVDTFFPALDAIGERVVDLEEAVLAGDTDIQAQIFAIRKELIGVRRVIGPMRDAMVLLLRRDLGIISHETQRYLQDVYDHLIRLSESVEDYQDVMAGTLDANATMASNRVNTVARNLAAYAAIFAVVTMISGIYGMNFEHMPELGWRFGYGWALGLMVVGGGGLYIYFKRKGWL